jgi:hypothetical protein
MVSIYKYWCRQQVASFMRDLEKKTKVFVLWAERMIKTIDKPKTYIFAPL